MDVVELPPPAAVSVSKLLIAEGFGRQGVSVGESEAQELKTSVSICGRSAATRGSDSSDVICAIPNLEQNSVSRAKKADIRFCKLDSSLANFGGEDISKHITIKNRNGSPSSLPKYTAKQLHQKSGKTSKNSSPCSKKQKAEQMEGSMSQATIEDAQNTSGKHGSILMRSTFSEKSHLVGHKHGVNGRRGDNRNFKAPTKTKFDPFCPKIGSMGVKAAGGENILGIYGLRSDIHDVTKHVDELSLNDLLDGSYKCFSIYQGRGKKATNANENLVHMVRNACSVLQTWRAAHEQNSVELNSSSNKKMDASLLSSGSSMTIGAACGKRDSGMTDLASSSKDTCINPGAATTSSTSLLYKPHDILERLSLPPAKDLDSLLLESSKPTLSSKNSIDLRSSKSFSHGSRLPPFSWSHCPSGLSKTVVDTGRFSANRSTSQGRWVRIGSIARSLGGSPSSFSDQSLISDQENFIKGPDAKTSHPSLEHKLPQRFQDSFDRQLNFGFTVGNLLKVPESEGVLKHCENDVALISSSPNNLKDKCKGRIILDVNSSCSCCSSNKCSIGERDGFQSHSNTVDNSMRGYSPRLLVAAQTLYEMSRHSTVQNKNEGKLRSFKRPSQRVPKSCKSELMTVKSEDKPIKSEIEVSDPINIMDQMITSNKLKFSTNNKRKDGHTKNIGREPIKWSISTSSRSSPHRAENSDTRQSNADNVKLLGVMPPSKRTLDRACNNDQKIRKTVAIDSGRGRSNME